MSVKQEMIDQMRKKNQAIRECEDEDKLETLQNEFNELADEVKREKEIEDAEARREHEEETQDLGLHKAFTKYLNGEELSGNEREALAIRDESLRDKAGDDAIRCPGNALLFAEDAEDSVERATQVTSDVSDLQPYPNLSATFMMDLPPTPLADRSTKLQAINGVAIPIVDQTIADPFAGVSVGTSNEGADKNETFFNTDRVSITTTERNAYAVVADQALRRIPNLDSTLQQLFIGALEKDLDDRIMTEVSGLTGSTAVYRAGTDEIAWADMIDMETEIPWYWRQNLEYMLSETALGYIKKQLATNGQPLFATKTADAAYNSLNGYPWFLDDANALGSAGDLYLAPWDVVHVGIGKDIAFRRSNEGLALVKGNKTAFAVYSHMGIEVPIPELIVELQSETTEPTTTT